MPHRRPLTLPRVRWAAVVAALLAAAAGAAALSGAPASGVSVAAGSGTGERVAADPVESPDPSADPSPDSSSSAAGLPSALPSSLTPPPLMPSGAPTAAPSASPLPSPTAVPVAAPDRIDRRWPAHPPWDACPRPVWPGETSTEAPGNGRRVLVIGDSLTRESRRLTATLLRASGWTPTFRCWGSRRLDWGIDQVRRSQELGQLPRHVIVAMGTNDISWETPATTVARVRTLLRLLGPGREVLWVDLDVDHSSFSRARALWFNEMIREVAQERENLTIVPWRRVARAEQVGRYDGIHYGPAGYRLRARVVVDALDARARRAAADPTPN